MLSLGPRIPRSTDRKVRSDCKTQHVCTLAWGELLSMWLLTPPPNILEGIVKDFKFNVFLSRNRMSGKFVILGCKKTRKLDVAHFTIMFILYFPKIRPNIYSSCEYWLSATILIVMYYKQCRLLQANQV